MKAQEIFGKEVIGAGGWFIGKVTDVILDTTTWQAKKLEVKLAKSIAVEFGMKKLLKTTAVQIDVDHIEGVGDHITLKISKEQLRAALEPKVLLPDQPKVEA